MKKPFSRAEVFARIERLLDSGRLERATEPEPETADSSNEIAPESDESGTGEMESATEARSATDHDSSKSQVP